MMLEHFVNEDRVAIYYEKLQKAMTNFRLTLLPV